MSEFISPVISPQKDHGKVLASQASDNIFAHMTAQVNPIDRNDDIIDTQRTLDVVLKTTNKAKIIRILTSSSRIPENCDLP